jgi:hypothetical protein
VGAGRLLLIHQTRGKRVGNKKRPQVDSCDPLKQKAKQEQQTQLQNSKDLNGAQGEFLAREMIGSELRSYSPQRTQRARSFGEEVLRVTQEPARMPALQRHVGNPQDKRDPKWRRKAASTLGARCGSGVANGGRFG